MIPELVITISGIRIRGSVPHEVRKRGGRSRHFAPLWCSTGPPVWCCTGPPSDAALDPQSGAALDPPSGAALEMTCALA